MPLSERSGGGVGGREQVHVDLDACQQPWKSQPGDQGGPDNWEW